MMMYERLVKNLRDDTALQNCEFDFVRAWMHEAADAIEKLSKKLFYAELSEAHTLEIQKALLDSVKIPRWVPVEERLPEENGSYLIVDGGTVTQIVSEAYYDKDWGDSCWTDPVEMYMTYHPTHWMPLPEPPESEGE